jgi:type IV secretory pathway VirB4 component
MAWASVSLVILKNLFSFLPQSTKMHNKIFFSKIYGCILHEIFIWAMKTNTKDTFAVFRNHNAYFNPTSVVADGITVQKTPS